MGNCFTNAADTEPPAPKVYSWDKRRQEQSVDPAKYTVADKDGETVIKSPGDVDGQQFIIRNCKNSNIYVFDHSATVTVDDCTRCNIFLGPVKGSVFLRDSSHLQCALSCQQFRTRDCKRVTCLMSCATQPIIEASSGMKFGCLQVYYRQLEEHFAKANLSVYNNNWSGIHDFTPSDIDVAEHWSTLPVTALEDVVPLLTTDNAAMEKLELDTSQKRSVIPLTLGSHVKGRDPVCLIVFFESQNYHAKIKEFFRAALEKVDVIQTKEVTMNIHDCQRVFRQRHAEFSQVVEHGPVIGVELYGEDCIDQCNDLLTSLSDNSGKVFVSADPTSASKDVDMFYNFVSMAMST